MPRYACNTAALSLPHMKLDWTSPLLKHVRATSNPSWIGNVSGTRQRRLPRRHPSSSTGCISRTAETASLKPVYPASLLPLSLSPCFAPCSLPHAAPSSPRRRPPVGRRVAVLAGQTGRHGTAKSPPGRAAGRCLCSWHGPHGLCGAEPGAPNAQECPSPHGPTGTTEC
jgi:hypothetical protein